jgi:subtilisin family serine protease
VAGLVVVATFGGWRACQRAIAWPADGDHGRRGTRSTGQELWAASPLDERDRHLALLGVPNWHERGYRGQGVTIAVLDWGFRGYKQHLGHVLPDQVGVHSCRPDNNLEARNSQHGILCAEVLHALAPDARILFANWEPDRPDQFLEAVRWARDQGARVLSCSLIMPTWSDGDGGGSTHQALARLLRPVDGTGEALLFASAGNTAQRHWSGRFHPGADGCHQWRPGRADNGLVLWRGEQVSVEACWHPGPEYEVTVIDQNIGREVPYQLQGKQAEGRAIARFVPLAGHTYTVRFHLLSGPPGLFHLVALGAGLQYSTAGGSIPFPADGPEIIAVGAVSAGGRRMLYSSCGSDPGRLKPELVAPVPFVSLWRAQPFSGTSAAAPQAAGLAALIWSRHPDWSASQVRRGLLTAARDLGPPGPDVETGFGMVGLPD